MPRPRKPKWPPLPRRIYGSGSIQRLPNGDLRARLPKRIDPKRTAREFGPDELDAAEQWIAAFMTGVTHSALTPLGDWAGYWWETYVKPPVRPETTARLYLHALTLLSQHNAVPLGSLRSTHFQEIIGALAGRLAPSTLAVRVSIWRSCLEAAVDAELISRNPVRGLVIPEAPKSTARRGWTEKEARGLWAAIRGHRFEAIFALVLGCGLRIGEVLGLAWKDVDFANHRAWVSDQYTDGVWRSTPKGNNPHWVHVPQTVLYILSRHHESQPIGTRLCFASPYRRTPHSVAGKARLVADAKAKRSEYPWSYATVRRDFLKLAEDVGIVDRKQHGGRHALGSYLIDEGVPAPVVAEILGHADAAVTLGVYSHASDRSRERARELVDRLLSDVVSGDDAED